MFYIPYIGKRGNVLPILANQVFLDEIQLFQEKNELVKVCDFESDEEIAAFSISIGLLSKIFRKQYYIKYIEFSYIIFNLQCSCFK